jgi:outer membrane protein TolC
MRRPASTWRILLVSLLVGTIGCSPTQPFYLREDGDLSHYIDKATQAETPDFDQPPLADVEHAQRPLSLSNPEIKEDWYLTLEECVAIALANTKIIRGGQPARLQNGQVFAGTQEGSLLNNSFGRINASTYDPAIVESNPGQSQFSLFGLGTAEGGSVDGGVANVRQGVEAALADFDAQLSISGSPGGIIASSTDQPRNVGSAIPGFVSVIDARNGGLRYDLTKRAATGTQFSVRGITEYDRSNRFGTLQALNSFWTQNIEVEVRHPLLRGRGEQINRMPIYLARLGTDIEITALQANLQDMLNNLEVRYWDLYLAYRNLETAKISRDSALETWRIAYSKFAGDVSDRREESQAREQYYNFRAAVEATLRSVFDAENELRLLMGLAATDGRLIRPKDDPSLAKIDFDWSEILAEAIARRPELVQQRWRIKQREMELILARNRLLPQLDVGAQYRWIGVGDDLIEADRNGIPFPAVGSTAWEELTGGSFQEFGFLLQYQMPIGFRRELAGVRHAQLRLVRERAFLEDMELDASHGLSHAIRNLETNFQLAQTNVNRWAAAEDEVRVSEELFRGGRITLDLVLEAQRRRAVAQSSFWSSVIEYNKAIADLHTRKGSIMEYDGVGFDEGPWPQKAYWDALGRARERDAGTYVDYGWTRPKVISRGPIHQTTPHVISGMMETMPGAAPAEELPTPQPTPARRPVEGTPAPGTGPVPQEIRNESELLNTKPVSSTPPTLSVGKPIKPAAYFPPSSDDNPLRGGSGRPIGTGVSVEIQ